MATFFIKGRIFDPALADLVFENDNGLPTDEPGYYVERLYHTSAGRWVRWGGGDELSRYAVTRGEHTIPGQKVVELSEQEAVAWLEASGASPDVLEGILELPKA